VDLGRFYCQARYQQILFRCDNVASDVTGVLMAKRADLDGAAHLMLAPGVRHLDEEMAVFQAMLEGWKRQQDSRYLRERTIGARLRTVRRFAEFTGQYPWQWGPAEVEAFTSDLVSGSRPAAHSTVRNYQTALQLFCTFITDARYGWAEECERRFGEAPVQICHEWNTVAHLAEYEGQPGRRALTYDEVQALFDAADARAGQIRGRGRKGALAALRDAAIIKVTYAYGLRRRETAMLDVADFRRNPRAAQYGTFGSVQVRYGKASRGSPPRRRTVLTVPEFDWVTGVLAHWVTELRPRLSPGNHPALWVTERRGRVSVTYLNDMFARIRDAAGLPESADLHSLRHSYVTHLLEFNYPPLMVQQQVGHAWGSTTALYTSVSDEFRNQLLEQALRDHPDLWTEDP
jgi:site-specific recombinase XerD